MAFKIPSSTATATASTSTSTSTSISTSRKNKRSSRAPAAAPRNPSKLPRTTGNSPFANFGSYMAEKNRKLRVQFDADASSRVGGDGDGGDDSSGVDKGIFHGVSIFVNGLTTPSSQELKGIMLKHGGRFENYFSKHAVTHIICSNLPDSKIRNLREFSHGLPVVRPEWVLDCMAANKLLSCGRYQFEEHVCGTYKQQKLSAFFHYYGQSCKVERHGEAESACYENEERSAGISAVEANKCQDEPSAVEESGSRIRSPSMDDCSYNDSTNNSELPETKYAGASNPPHSSLTDPNFVENYFKSSRLHFIGTWRNRYRRRFSKFCSGFEKGNHKANCHSVVQNAAMIHIDMDCFFVSVITRNRPDLLDKPVAVCHSSNPRGTAEISSANYTARVHGVKTGMFVRDAKACCPQLFIVPYDFEAYEEVADRFYGILHKHCDKVQALSCDEAFLDVTGYTTSPEELALVIRKEIEETTRCTASAGIAENLLLARLATRSAKPNGQRFIPSEKIKDYLDELPIEALPGIGNSTYDKLKKRHIQTCGEMRMIPKEVLQRDFGRKTGDMLWNYCRGIDDRKVEAIQDTKTVGAEVNWGIRFRTVSDCHHFLMNLCKEVSSRLQDCGVQGRTITLKVRKRRKGAEEPAKFMGCGDCESMSRSMKVPVATDDISILQRIVTQIFGSFHLDVKEVRGVGLHISRLESMGTREKGLIESSLKRWFSSSKGKREGNSIGKMNNEDGTSEDGEQQLRYRNCLNQQSHEKSVNQQSCEKSEIHHTRSDHPCGFKPHCAKPYEVGALPYPPLCDLDLEVVKNLPTEIVSEMNNIYKGELSHFLGKKEENHSSVSSLSKESKVVGSDSVEICSSSNFKTEGQCLVILPENMKIMEKEYLNLEYTSCSMSSDMHTVSAMGLKPFDVMPGSLSQTDMSVLQELPGCMNADLLELLPAHRKLEPLHIAPDSNIPSSVGCYSMEALKEDLWFGCPPQWIEKFKNSNCFFLNVFADLYTKSRTILLSSVFESIVPLLPLLSQSSKEECDEILSNLHELLAQYIDMKISTDLEELYSCFCFLKRFSSMSKLLAQLYNSALPLFQVSTSETYGGKLLHLSAIEE